MDDILSFGGFLGELFLHGEFLAVIGAAIAAIFPGIGSARAVGAVGESLNGLMSEDPDKFGKGFLLQALPATQGIYGLIVAFIVLTRIGIMGGNVIEDVNIAEGVYYLAACLPIAVTGYYSAIKQGRVASAGIAMIARHPEASGKAVISTAMVELYALLSLLISFLLVFFAPFGA